MAIVTNILLYCFPYILSLFLGVFLSGIWNKWQSSQLQAPKKQPLSKEYNHSKTKGESTESNDESNQEDCSKNDDEDIGFNLQEGTHIPFRMKLNFTEGEMVQRSQQFYKEMNDRRSVRFYSDKPVPLRVIENIIKTAGTSPSGAHTQPWVFSVVRDQVMKMKVREIIEDEEKINYERRMGKKWLDDLKPWGNTYKKPYLSKCSTLIILFKQVYSFTEYGEKKTHYYHEISTSIAAGLMLAAIQNAGLVTCTTTPMNAGPRLRKLLGRQPYEKVMLLFPVGYPADNATVPDLHRKPLGEIFDLHDKIED